MAVSLLDRAIYSYADVDRLVGMRPGTARRWLEGYQRGGHPYEPVLRPARTGHDAVTWGEFVEARLLSEFRDRNIGVQRLRPAVELLRAEFGPYPLAQARPLLDVEGRELVMRVQQEVALDKPLLLVVLTKGGQLALAEPTRRFHESAEYRDDIVTSLRPSAHAPAVRIDPQRAFGQPTIRSVRTDVLAEDYRAGASREELSDLYELTPDEIDQALRYELIASHQQSA